MQFDKDYVSIINSFSAPFGLKLAKCFWLVERASHSCFLCHCSVRMLPGACLVPAHCGCTELWVCEYAPSVLDLELFHMPPLEHSEVNVVQAGYTSGKIISFLNMWNIEKSCQYNDFDWFAVMKWETYCQFSKTLSPCLFFLC